MKLVIVESPTKAKTITKFLGDEYVVKSSYGHIRDLPKGELGVDLEKDFEPKYVIPTKARKNLTALKKDAAKADTIILATDEDREGEAIAWHLSQALDLVPTKKKKSKKEDTGETKAPQVVQRIVFHEITESAIKEALANPRDIDQHLVNSQQARRIMDRLVGYKLSPILWKRYYRGLSAGRVQSVATRLIVEREREIEKFKPEEYWSITAMLESPSDRSVPVEAQLQAIDGKTVEKLEIKNQEHADKITSELGGASYVVKNVEKNETLRHPSAPFTTSTLQQEAAKKLHFSSKQTMMLAQQLYEAGHITYMRTDSVSLSAQSLAQVSEYITKELGKEYLFPRKYKTKSKGAQEAHEAVRPTNPFKTPDELKPELDPKQGKLYELIWRRFTASQTAPAKFDASVIDIETGRYSFRANGITMKFAGFLKIYPTKFEDRNLPVVKTGEALDLKELKPEQHFTKPPARFNEASLIKTLEKEGIGRPSTYAAIISTIIFRKYVEKDRSRYFHPTEIGTLVNEFLVEHFPEIVDVKFTSHMEEELDEIAAGKVAWVPIIKEFYQPMADKLEQNMEFAQQQKEAETEKTDKICDKCGSPMVVKRGRFGKFIACSNFPTCKNILKEKKDAAPVEKVGRACPDDGGDLIYRNGRFGKFIACANFPKCKYTEKIAKEAAPVTEEK